jgi:hypothetical protein
MAQPILVDEFHVSLFMPRELDRQEDEAIRRTLHRPRFGLELGKSLRAVVRRHRSLRKVRVSISR